MKKTLQIIISFLFFIITIYFVYSMLKKLLSFFVSLESEISITIIGAVSTFTVSIITITVGKYYEKKRQIEQEIREKKIPVYEEFLDFLFKMFIKAKENNMDDIEEEMIDFFYKFNQKIIIWGSDDVIKLWSEYRIKAVNQKNLKPEETMFHIEKILLAIRKDTGHKNKNLVKGDILGLFINDIQSHLYSKE